MAVFMSTDPTPSVWPAKTVAFASEAENSAPAAARARAGRTLVVDLSGSPNLNERHLAQALGARLSVPDLILSQDKLITPAVIKRLGIMASSERHVILALRHAEKLPLAVVGYILDLVNNSPLRLLVIRDPSQDYQSLQNRVTTAGLDWIDLDPSELTAETPVAEPPKPSRGDTPAAIDGALDDEPKKETRSKPSLGIAGIAGIALGLLCGAAVIGWWMYEKPSDTIVEDKAKVMDAFVLTPQQPALRGTPLKQPSARTIPTTAVEPKVVERIATELTDPIAKPISSSPAASTSPVEAESNNALPEYTIQIASYESIDAANRFIDSLQDAPEALRVMAKESDEPNRVLVYGRYKGYSAAAAALDSLPEQLVHGEPFVVGLNKFVKSEL